MNSTLPFDVQPLPGAHLMVVQLKNDFTAEDSEALSGFMASNLESGFLNWDLDLRQIKVFNSLMMGSLIGMNTVLRTRKGSLRLIVEKKSRVAGLIHLSRLNRIIAVHEVDRKRPGGTATEPPMVANEAPATTESNSVPPAS